MRLFHAFGCGQPCHHLLFRVQHNDQHDYEQHDDRRAVLWAMHIPVFLLVACVDHDCQQLHRDVLLHAANRLLSGDTGNPVRHHHHQLRRRHHQQHYNDGGTNNDNDNDDNRGTVPVYLFGWGLDVHVGNMPRYAGLPGSRHRTLFTERIDQLCRLCVVGFEPGETPVAW